jgi:uncharacterized protein YbaP (TraB family)
MAAIAVVAAAPAAAQNKAGGATAAEARAADRPQRGFLWEARKDKARIYLLGTIHVGRAEASRPAVNCAQRYAEAAVIAVEADVFDAGRVGDVVQRLALYPPGAPGLDTRLPARLVGRIEALLPRYGVEAARLWRMKPWMLSNTLTILEAVHSGLTPAHATEAFLYTFAQSCGKPIVEIEGVERQLAVFDGASPELQIRILEQTVEAIDSGLAVKEMRRIVSAWETGDVKAAEALVAEMRANPGEVERFVVDQLIEGRHAHMVEVAERLAATDRLHLFAVGALHYFGPRGLLVLLRERGYTITPLR